MSDLVKEFYTSARAELLQRVTLRDQALIAYVVALGAYFGFVASHPSMVIINTSNSSEALVALVAAAALPMISLIFTLIVLQHHNIIGSIAKYLHSELITSKNPPHWDISQHNANLGYISLLRTLAQILMLSGPSVYGFAFFFSNIGVKSQNIPVYRGLWAVFCWDVLIMLAIIGLHIHSHRYRSRCRPASTPPAPPAPPAPVPAASPPPAAP